MLLITTPTGHSGSAVAAHVLASGVPARLFVRDRSRLRAEAAQYTEIVEGDLRDEAALAQAAHGIEAAFFCVPQSGDAPDVHAYYASFAELAAQTFRTAQVQRVVTISGGRGNPDDIGISGPLAHMEKTFDATGLRTRHLRCGYFMENFLYVVPQLQYQSSFSLPLSPDYPLALMAAQDIGRTAARWLLDAGWTGQEGLSIPYGQSLTCTQIAAILSDVLKKEITFNPITADEYEQSLIRFGLSEAMGRSLKEMFLDTDRGSIGGNSGVSHSGGLSFADWAQQHLVPVFQ